MNLLMINGFTIFGFSVKFYGIIMACSFLLATLLCVYIFKKKDYYKELPYTLLLIVFPCAIFGARLYFVIFQSGINYSFGEFFAIWNGGLAIFGGIIGGLIAIIIYCVIKKINILTILDVVAPCLILAQALGRWGNFFNQEAYGNLITNSNLQFFPFGVYIESSNFTEIARQQVINFYGTLQSGAWFNATFFYESFWNFLSFFVLIYIILKSDRQGLATGVYLFLYGIARFFIEALRTDSLYIGWTNIRVSQIVSIICILVGITLLVLSAIGKLQANEKSKPYEINFKK